MGTVGTPERFFIEWKETDWSGLLPSGDCSFVLGNPPFVGAKYQTSDQRAQLRGIASLGKGGGTLDYVAA